MNSSILDNRPAAASRVNVHPLMMVPTPPPPPGVSAGCGAGPPDFVGVGAQRSGTTWWWSVINSHPQVALAGLDGDDRPPPQLLLRTLNQRKELHFFDHYGKIENVDPALYHRHFPRPEGRIVGEWTPRYMYDFWTPPMLHSLAPEAKILVMLRDPLDRFFSGLAHATRMAQALGFDYEPETFAHHEQFSRGLYWCQLQNLLRYFDRGNVLILQYEQCVAAVARQARLTFSFLGLDPDRWQLSEETTRPAGPASAPRPALNDATSEALARAYQPELERLLADFPELDGSLWPTVKARTP